MVNVTKSNINVTKIKIMVRTKNNFICFRSSCSGAGKTSNETLFDGSVAVGAYSEKIVPSAFAQMSPLEQSTPYEVSQMPESVKTDIERE